MYKISKIALIIGLISLIFTFGVFAEEETPVVPRPEIEDKTISVLLKDTPGYQLFKEWTPEFEEMTGINVKVDILPEKGFLDKVTISLSSGSGEYDVIAANQRSLGKMMSGGWVRPVDEFIKDEEVTPPEWYESFIDKPLETLKYQGKQYGLPHEAGGDILYYNKNMFKEAGLDPNNPPQNMDEVLNYAKKQRTAPLQFAHSQLL